MLNQTQFRVPEILIVQISRRMVKVNSEGKNSLEPFSKELKVVLLYSIKTVVSHLKVSRNTQSGSGYQSYVWDVTLGLPMLLSIVIH